MQTGVWDGGRYDAKPKGIAIAPDGKPWFAEADAGNPGYRLGTTGGASSATLEYRPCPTAALCSGSFTGTGLSDVAVAADGTVWYTNEIKKTIGRFVPGEHDLLRSSRWQTSTPRSASARRARCARRPDGAIWAAITGGFSAPGANAILRIVPSATPTVTTYKLGAVAAAVRSRARAQRRRLVHGLPGDRQRADRPADRERDARSGPDPDPHARPGHRRRPEPTATPRRWTRTST